MKKLKYINILLALLLVFVGVSVYAEEGSENTTSSQDGVVEVTEVTIEREMIKDRIEKEKMMHIKNDAMKTRPSMQEKREPGAVDAFKLKRIENKGEIETKRAEVKEKALERRENMQEKIEDRKEMHEERMEDRAEAWQNRTTARLRAGFLRLAKITERLENRIAKIDEAGGNTANAKNLIQSAKDKIERAKNQVEEIKNINDTESDEDDSLTELRQNPLIKKLLPLAQEVQKTLKSAHQDLINAVRVLKQDNKKEKLETDGSPSTQDNGSDNNEQN